MLLNIYNKLECAQSKFPALRRFRFRICSGNLQAQFCTSLTVNNGRQRLRNGIVPLC
jgi:hypothetical protein